MEIGPVVSSGEYPGMKNGGKSYNMSQPVNRTKRDRLKNLTAAADS